MNNLLKTRTIEEEQAFVEVLNAYHPEWMSAIRSRQIAQFRHFFVNGAIHRDNIAKDKEPVKVVGDATTTNVIAMTELEVKEFCNGRTPLVTEDVFPIEGNTFENLELDIKAGKPISMKEWVCPSGVDTPTLSEYLGKEVLMPVGQRLLRELGHKFPLEVRLNESCTEAYIVTAESSYVDSYTIGYTYERKDVYFWLKYKGGIIAKAETPMECLEALRDRLLMPRRD